MLTICRACVWEDDQSCRHCYREKAREAASPHHAHHGLPPDSVPEETGSSRSGPGAILSKAILGRIAQGGHY